LVEKPDQSHAHGAIRFFLGVRYGHGTRTTGGNRAGGACLLKNAATREREVRALGDALPGAPGAPVESALILCDANEDGFDIRGVPVEVRSTAEWFIKP